MPVYDYKCDSCGKTRERYEHLPMDTPPDCVNGCGPTRKVFSVCWAQFFGLGTYATEYGSQWRNKDGRAFRRKHEGNRFGAVEHSKKVMGASSNVS